jgi:hypothetical protein
LPTTAGSPAPRLILSALAGLVLAACIAGPASAATLSAPATIAPREVVAVTATGLGFGQRWGVFLARPRADGLNCIAPLARRTPAGGGKVVFSGRLPATMDCPAIPGAASAQPTPPGRTPVTPGRGYRLVACVAAGADCRFMPVARRAVRVVAAGASCPAPPGVTSLRARGVACSVAAGVARAPRASGAGLSCRGTRDRTAGRTVFRCTRAGARVTFARR